MSAVIDAATVEKLGAAFREAVRSSKELQSALRCFFDELWRALWNDPVLLRVTGRGMPKKVRRKTGRRIKQLERGLK